MHNVLRSVTRHLSGLGFMYLSMYCALKMRNTQRDPRLKESRVIFPRPKPLAPMALRQRGRGLCQGWTPWLASRPGPPRECCASLASRFQRELTLRAAGFAPTALTPPGGGYGLSHIPFGIWFGASRLRPPQPCAGAPGAFPERDGTVFDGLIQSSMRRRLLYISVSFCISIGNYHACSRNSSRTSNE